MKFFWFFGRRLTIARKLKEEGFTPLRRKRGEFWEKMAIIYREQNNNPRFIKYRAIYSNQEIAGRLEYQCKKTLNIPYDDNHEELYKNAKRWCVVPISIKDRAEKKGFSFLNMDEDSDKDQVFWELRIVHYYLKKGEIDLNDIFGYSYDLNQDVLAQKVKLLKAEAKKIIEIFNYDENEEFAWNTAIRWFTKNRP